MSENRTKDGDGRPGTLAPSAGARRRKAADVVSPSVSQDGATSVGERLGGGSNLALVPFSAVFDATELRWSQYVPTDELGSKRRIATLSSLRVLRPFWEQYRVGDVARRHDGAGTIDRYIAYRVDQPIMTGGRPHKSRKVSAGNAEHELRLLRAAVNEFKADRGLVGDFEWRVPSAEHAPVIWLERNEVARLLWAIRGRRWDAPTATWAVDSQGKRVTTKMIQWDAPRRRWDRQTRRWIIDDNGDSNATNAMEWIVRLVILLVYSGSTAACASRLRWQGSPEGSDSYVDLEAEIEGRTGHLYRLGADLASGSMAGIPVAVSRRLAAHLRRWRASDVRNGFRYVLHRSPQDDRNVRPPSDSRLISHKSLRKIWNLAGLDPSHTLSVLSCTCVVWILRSGSRKVGDLEQFRPGCAIRRSAAFMIGKDYKKFVERFESVTPDYLRAQIEALEAPAKTVT